MKLFLLLMSLGFYHGSFAASDLPVENISRFSTGSEKNEIIQHTHEHFSAVLSAIFIHTKIRKSIPQYRHSSFAKDFVNHHADKKSVSHFNNTSFVAPPYAYCKPIALFLIFPQHYFW